jgi:hypothetical protein
VPWEKQIAFAFNRELIVANAPDLAGVFGIVDILTPDWQVEESDSIRGGLLQHLDQETREVSSSFFYYERDCRPGPKT